MVGGHGQAASSRVALLWGVLVCVLTLSQSARSEPISTLDIVHLNYRTAESTFDPAAEVQLLDLLNRVRQEHGAPRLAMDPSLRSAARAHSQDMATRGYFGHDTLGGQSFAERLAGLLRYRMYVGENVALARSAEQANALFVASPGHFRTMLESRFHRVGIGIATAGQLGLMVTEDFSD